VLSDEVSEQLLIDASLVDNRGIPECAAKFDRLQQHWLSFLKAHVATKAVAETHGTEAWRLDMYVLELECLDHFVGMIDGMMVGFGMLLACKG
jgi:hypothetical protein